jgi:hypothetical protein
MTPEQLCQRLFEDLAKKKRSESFDGHLALLRSCVERAAKKEIKPEWYTQALAVMRKTKRFGWDAVRYPTLEDSKLIWNPLPGSFGSSRRRH